MNSTNLGAMVPWRVWTLALCMMLASCGGGGGSSSQPPGSGSGSDAGPTGLALLAGHVGGAGNVNGTGSQARFGDMEGVALDGAGNVYVADTRDQTIRRVTPSGVVTTFAGVSGVAGAMDGVLATATFNQPMALAFDPSGNLIVVDAGNNTIRKISAQGVVTTLAGKAGTSGHANGFGPAASFDFCRDTDIPREPRLAIDRSGNTYVLTCDTAIRRIAPDGTVSTLVNDPQSPATRVLLNPIGMAMGPDDALYVTDYPGILRITLDRQVSVVATLYGQTAAVIAVDANRTVYMATGGVLSTLDAAGNYQTIVPFAWGGSLDGPVAKAQFNRISDLAISPAGTIYLADAGNFTLRTLGKGVVSTLAGEPVFDNAVDGQGANAQFGYPEGIAIGTDGALYVADRDGYAIRRVTLDGQVSTLAGDLGEMPGSSADGLGAAAVFLGPSALASAPDGGLYVVDGVASAIRHVSLSGSVTTLNVDNPDRLWIPMFTGIAVRQDGSLAMTDWQSYVLATVPGAGGTMTTLAGQISISGSVDGGATTAQFAGPQGAVADKSGNLYVADGIGCTIRKVDARGNVTTLAGVAFQCGFSDGVGAQARFNFPLGIAIDATTGNLYVPDTYNHAVRKVTPQGVVTTVVGKFGCQGLVTGALPGCISWPLAVAVDGHTLYITTGRGVVVARGVP